jgi:hypothetical protein
MLFAATGHGPYQGETIMDVLTRLATEPPDLTDLPAELAGIVTACLSRDPRVRPTSVAVIAHLARELGSEADASELGPRVLPRLAVDLIAEYRRGPRPEDEPAAVLRDDATFDSQPVVDLPAGLAGAGPAWSAPAAAGSGPLGDGDPVRAASPGHSRARRARRVRLHALIGAAVALLALTAGGAVIGSYLAGGRAGAVGNQASNGSRSPSPSSRPSVDARTQGPNMGLPFGPPGGPPGPGQGFPGGPPPGGRPIPRLSIIRRFNGHYTVFILRGRAWPPGLPVTVSLAAVGTAPQHPRVDPAGHFTFILNGPNSFFHGKLGEAGTYLVSAFAPNGARAAKSFRIYR